MKRKLRMLRKMIPMLALFGLMIVPLLGWGQYAGAGTFTKITSVEELTDGYYVIVNSADAFAMNSTNAGKFFTHTAITPAAGVITDPTTDIVWNIETNGSGRSIYNEATAKFVSYTGSKNEAQAVDDVTADNQRWAFTYADDVFSVGNLAITARLLKYNSSAPRFACYTSGQQNLLLYKMGSVPTTPTIILNPPSLDGFTYVVGNGPSAEQEFTVAGSNLTADISIVPPTHYEISTSTGGSFSPTNPITLAHTAGTVDETTVYVRLKAGLAVGDYNGEEITASSTDADPKTVTCNGSVIDPNLNIEDFSKSNITASYANGSFVGNNDITWTYVQSRDGNGDANNSGIDLPALMLRDVSNNSAVSSSAIPGGIGDFSVKLYKGFTGGGDRQVELFINGISQGTSATFDDFDEHIFEVNGINISGDIIIEIKNTTSKQVIVDDISWTGFGTGGNTPPAITNITTDPASGFTSSTTVSVSADVTDDGTVEGVELHWGTTSGSLTNNINMSLASGDTYTTVTDIPAQVGGTTVYYEVYAMDDDADETTSPEQSYYVLSDEPTNHPTSFMADAATPTYSTIEVVWDDAIGAVLPAGYVIKASNDSFGAIVAPVDGTPETPGTLVKVVAAGVEYASFADLDDNTTYYFKIWPFTNSDAAIDYKTDGSVQQDEATTAIAPLATKVFISEYVEGSSNNKAVEIFNADNFALDLTKLSIRLYSNGSPTPNNTWSGTSGTLPPGQSIVIYNASAGPEIKAVGYESSNITFFNGDDALDVVYDSQVTDVFGTIGTDPGASWPVAGVAGATADHTLIRKLSVTQGNTDWASSAGTDATNSEWVVKDMDYFGNLSFVGTVFQGSSTDWADGANWDMGVPDEFTNAFINESVTVNDTGECNDLTILPIGTVTVGAGQGLIVHGNLLIESDATGTGSFIGAASDYTITGTQTIQRYVTGGPIGAGKFKYHLLSIPLDANIQAGDVFTGTYLWHFVPNQPDIDSWTGITSLTENLDYHKGFLSYVETADNTFSFTGNMNTGSFSTAAETISAGKYKLIPNPYPSAIDWETVDLTGTRLNPTIWLFNSETGNYDTYNNGVGDGQQYIPVGQAVFVEAASADPTLTFTNSNRTHEQGNGFYKSGNENPKDILKIAVTANQSADATFIRFRELADNNYNGFDDASKLRGFAGSPQLYTQSTDDKALSINTLATSQETVIVPLAYELEVAGEAVLSFEYLETFEPTVTIFLEDLLLDEMINLREESTYSFEHAVENDPLRFKIHFMGVTNVNEMASSNENFNIWTSDKQLYILANTAVDGDLQIDLFDLSGRLLQTVSQPMQTPNRISLADYEGVIMVRVRTDSAIQTQKIFIR